MLAIAIGDRSEVNEDRLSEIGLWYLPATQLAFIVASAVRRGWEGWVAAVAVSWLNLAFLDTDSLWIGVLLNFGVRYAFSTARSEPDGASSGTRNCEN